MAGDWSSLPLDVLTLIAMKLETLEDFIYFSVVCRWWNYVSSLIKPQWNKELVPHLLLVENYKENPHCVRKIIDPSKNKCYEMNLPETFGTRCWGSAYGWVAMVDQKMNVRLLNPITKAQIIFPSLETFPSPPPKKITEAKHMYSNWHFYLTKLIVLKVSQSDHHEFIIMAIYNFYGKSLAFSRSGDQSWTSIITKETSVPMVDVTNMNDFVFLLYEDGSMGYWNVQDLYGHQVVKAIDYSSPNLDISETNKRRVYKIYLVKSGVDLLAVMRHKYSTTNLDIMICLGTDYHTYGFTVYKFHPKDKSWETIRELGDVALFVGCNYSMSVSCALAKKLKPSCIYCTDDAAELWGIGTKYAGHDIGIYDTRTWEKRQLYEDDDMQTPHYCPPIWFIPQL